MQTVRVNSSISINRYAQGVPHVITPIAAYM